MRTKKKKLWNMQMTVMLVIVSAPGTFQKGLERGLELLEIRGRIETIQTPALLRSEY